MNRPLQFVAKNIPKEKFRQYGESALTVAERFLLGLWDLIDDMDYGRYHPRLVSEYGAREARAIVAANDQRRAEREQKLAIRRLKRNKWIKQRNEGNRIEYELTNNGRLAALEVLIRTVERRLPEKQCCLVVFDFPEAARHSRQSFRRLLKRIGFECMQLSVWRSDKDILDEIRKMIRLLKVERWVRAYRSEEK